MGTDTGEVCHSYVRFTGPVDQRQAHDPQVVVREPNTRLDQKPPVYLVDDLDDAGKDTGKERDGPLFHRFRQERMVRVGKRLPGYAPRLVPFQIVFINQQTHQLGYPDGWVGVIDLDGKAFGKTSDAFTQQEMERDHVLQRTGNKKVLLAKAKKLPDFRLVIGIQDLADGFGENLVIDGLVVISGVERLEFEHRHSL